MSVIAWAANIQSNVYSCLILSRLIKSHQIFHAREVAVDLAAGNFDISCLEESINIISSNIKHYISLYYSALCNCEICTFSDSDSGLSFCCCYSAVNDECAFNYYALSSSDSCRAVSSSNGVIMTVEVKSNI